MDSTKFKTSHFYVFSVYFKSGIERERDSRHVHELGRNNGGGVLSQAGSTPSAEPDAGLIWSHEIMT